MYKKASDSKKSDAFLLPRHTLEASDYSKIGPFLHNLGDPIYRRPVDFSPATLYIKIDRSTSNRSFFSLTSPTLSNMSALMYNIVIQPIMRGWRYCSNLYDDSLDDWITHLGNQLNVPRSYQHPRVIWQCWMLRSTCDHADYVSNMYILLNDAMMTPMQADTIQIDHIETELNSHILSKPSVE